MSDPQQATLETYRDQMVEASRGAGEHRALAAADDDGWADAAWREIRRLAARGVEFSADEIASACGPAPSDGAAGAVFRAAAATGLIRRVGYRESSRISRHGGLQRVWRGAEPR